MCAYDRRVSAGCATSEYYREETPGYFEHVQNFRGFAVSHTASTDDQGCSGDLQGCLSDEQGLASAAIRRTIPVHVIRSH